MVCKIRSVSLFLLITVISSASCETLKLNPPLVSGGNITVHRISPDGNHVVYRADQDEDEVFELYSVPLQGGNSTRINGPLVDGGNVHSTFQFVPNSDRVVYLADQDRDEALEIYLAPVDGSFAPVKLNQPLAGGTVDPFDFGVSDDGQHVVYLADEGGDQRNDVFSARLDGSGDAVQLNMPGLIDHEVRSFKISPDSKTVVYRGIQDTAFTDELYSRPIDGSGDAVKLNGPLVRGGDVDFLFAITPDSGRVVFRADQIVDQQLELYSRNLDGSSEPIRINAQLADDGRVGGFRILPNSSQVVYTAEQDKSDTLELYVRSIDGSGMPTKLNGSLVTGGNVFIDDVASDGSHAVYLADQEIDEIQEAFVVEVSGAGDPVKLNGTLTKDGEVIGGQITPDGNYYIHFADQDTAGVEVYSSLIDGSGEATKLNPPLDEGNSIGAFGVSDDSQRVLLLEGNIFLGKALHLAPTSGGTTRQVNDPLAGGIHGLSEFAPDSRTIVYRAEGDTAGVIELYRFRLNCDLNDDINCNVQDMDFYWSDMNDLNGDGLANHGDIDHLLLLIAQDNGFDDAYRPGDTNLDGAVAFDDFLSLSVSFGQAGHWSSGDFDANGLVQFADFLWMSVNFGHRMSTRVAVPEPSHAITLACCLIVLLATQRRSVYSE